ncbi:hypothetical protein F5Y15DRAFT_403009 [Xylariaceae sp. FL0016]|nr:hypothetical protein F5Y15DRAFT_403009 [Xylariaceae sp. FL0016]
MVRCYLCSLPRDPISHVFPCPPWAVQHPYDLLSPDPIEFETSYGLYLGLFLSWSRLTAARIVPKCAIIPETLSAVLDLIDASQPTHLQGQDFILRKRYSTGVIAMPSGRFKRRKISSRSDTPNQNHDPDRNDDSVSSIGPESHRVAADTLGHSSVASLKSRPPSNTLAPEASRTPLRRPPELHNGIKRGKLGASSTRSLPPDTTQRKHTPRLRPALGSTISADLETQTIHSTIPTSGDSLQHTYRNTPKPGPGPISQLTLHALRQEAALREPSPDSCALTVIEFNNRPVLAHTNRWLQYSSITSSALRHFHPEAVRFPLPQPFISLERITHGIFLSLVTTEGVTMKQFYLGIVDDVNEPFDIYGPHIRLGQDFWDKMFILRRESKNTATLVPGELSTCGVSQINGAFNGPCYDFNSIQSMGNSQTKYAPTMASTSALEPSSNSASFWNNNTLAFAPQPGFGPAMSNTTGSYHNLNYYDGTNLPDIAWNFGHGSSHPPQGEFYMTPHNEVQTSAPMWRQSYHRPLPPASNHTESAAFFVGYTGLGSTMPPEHAAFNQQRAPHHP